MRIEPASLSADKASPSPIAPTHVVQRGETMGKIAAQHKVALTDLQNANPQVLNPDVIYPGQSLTIPATGDSGHGNAAPAAATSASPAPTPPAPTANAPATPVAASSGSSAKVDVSLNPKDWHDTRDALTGKETPSQPNGTSETKTKTTPTVGIGSNGVSVGGSDKTTTTTTDSAGNKEKTSAGVNGSVGFDPSKGTISLSGGTSFSKELTSAKGNGVSFGIDTKSTVTGGIKTDKGVTTYSASTDVSVTLKGGVSSKQAGLQIGVTEGIKSSFSVAMPESAAKLTDLAKVNPFDADSMPKGTKISMDGSTCSGTEFEATFRNIAVQTKVTNEKGAATVIEKTGDHAVRVTAGPKEAVEAYNGVGVDFDVARLMLGRNDKLSSATLKTAEFDLSTTEGKAAYADFLATGALPKDNGTGISGVSTIEKLDFSSQSKLDAKLGPLNLSLDGAKNSGNQIVTTLPDGSMSRTLDLRYGGNVPMTLSQTFGADGKEIVSERRYDYTIKADGNIAQMLNVAQSGDLKQAQSGPVQAGKTVVLSYTEDQMRALMQDAQSAVRGNPMMNDLRILTQDYDGQFVDSPWDFAIGMARNLGGSDYGSAERLYDISTWASGQDMRMRDLTALPGTVTVLK